MARKIRVNSVAELSDEDTLPFGKYKSRLIKNIMGEDPGYLLWFHEKVEGYKIEKSVLMECENNQDQEFDEAYENEMSELYNDIHHGKW